MDNIAVNFHKPNVDHMEILPINGGTANIGLVDSLQVSTNCNTCWIFYITYALDDKFMVRMTLYTNTFV